MTKLRLGTRASALARWQAHWVRDRLVEEGFEVELIPITTRGDTITGTALANIGSPGVFTKELQRALLDEQIDLAVHSLKDLPTDRVAGLVLASVPRREDARDVLIARQNERLDQLPPQAILGTGSLRRRAQLLHRRADLQMRDIRGNVDTRLDKLAAGQYDAIVLALAGLKRLRLDARASEIFAHDVLMPAVGQGALGIEARGDDQRTLSAVALLDDVPTHQAVLAERRLLENLAGGCLAPIGAFAAPQSDGQLRLDAVVLSDDGARRLAAAATSPLSAADQLGAAVAADLLAQGAAELVTRA